MTLLTGYPGTGIFDSNIISITPAGFVPLRFADPNVQFVDAECSCPSQFIPCIWDANTNLKITNSGDASDQIQLGVQITGHTAPGSFIPIGDPFHMDAGASLNLNVSIHFNTDYWNVTEDIELIFVIGHWINDTQIQVTDNIPFYTQIYVENGNGVCSDYINQTDCVNAQCYWWSNNTCHDIPENGNGVVCEDIKNQPDCLANNCFWYKKYLWEGEKCYTEKEDFLMNNLPIILAGVGGVIIVIALATRSPKPQYRPPPPQSQAYG